MKAETIISVGGMPPPQSRTERPAAPGAETPRYDPRTRALIEGPIVPTLLRLAALGISPYCGAISLMNDCIGNDDQDPRWPVYLWSARKS
ncbi:MAG: hypothetical protein WA838_16525, partial [Xanthobacteraceae bacterium]